MRFLGYSLGLWALVLWAALGIARGESGSGKLTYTKVLKGSVPEYMSITVDASGESVYDGRKLDEAPQPRAFRLSAATTRRLFELARELNYFHAIDLESHRKVANLGRKTFVYEHQGRRNEAQFNYSLRREAQELSELFDRIATVQEHIAVLQHAIKFDHLSLPNELMRIQSDLEKRSLADPQQMVPVLELIARNPRFLHLAQVRAQNLLERLQNHP
jgi:hypothetical protein